MSTENSGKIGVVIMTYGSATTADHVEEYFERIYKGRASQATIEDFKRRYELVGRSPLVDITNAQAEHLQELLGDTYVVRAGMRHSTPYISDAVAECVALGATSFIGIILSPQFSSFIMEGYTSAFKEAVSTHGLQGLLTPAIVADSWQNEPNFIALLAKRTQEALTRLDKIHGVPVPVVFTTHSLPQRVVEKDPQYLKQLAETIAAVRAELDSSDSETSQRSWYAGYQSAGHTPEEWLAPDLLDIVKELKTQEAPAVLIVPIQFLADHLEILYDLDIAAKAQCEELGIEYNRIELPNTDPLFIASLSSIARSLSSVHEKTI